MDQLIKDIITKLQTITDFKHVAVWNNQVQYMEEGSLYSFADPAAFVEIVNPTSTKQLGNGVQIYDPVRVRVHTVHRQEDAGNGTMEQNYSVFTLKQKVYDKLNKFEPTGAVAFVRQAEEQDYTHTNVYHYIQDYVTNYIDNSKKEPQGGIETTPPTVLETTESYDPQKPYTKTL